MRREIKVGLLTLGALALMDFAVATALTVADAAIPPLQPLVRYFEYGRSVPGKIDRWIAEPDAPGALLDVGWRDAILRNSAEGFAEDPPGPTLRVYGMSFSNHIATAARALEPSLRVDSHGGPSAPPNFAYALFEDDRANRREGDAVALAILSSSVPAMAALSNRTWVFEQPAPFTYPIYAAEGDGLRRIDPLVESLAEEMAARADPALGAAWRAQLAAEDAFYGPAAFGATTLDRSPFFRQVRRALALGAIARREAAVLEGRAGPAPVGETIRAMIRSFAQTARADGQTPVVLLIQTRDPADVDVLALARAALERDDVPYLATAELVDPGDPSVFLPDGHYTEAANRVFGASLLERLADSGSRVGSADGAR